MQNNTGRHIGMIMPIEALADEIRNRFGEL